MFPLLTSYVSLEPSFEGVFGKLSYASNQNPELATSLSFLFTLGVMVCVAAGGFMYMRAGAIRIKASESAIRKSNEEIKRVTLGLVGVLSLFVIIYTLNKDLLNVDVPLQSLAAKNTGTPIATTPAQTPAQSGSPTYEARVASHNAVVARLAPSGIHTNHNDQPCTENQFGQSTPSCTSLAYLPDDTVNMLLRLKQYCNCSVVISGGTEPGHKSHGENLRPVDLQISASQNTNDPLYKWVSVAGTPLGSSSNCYAQFSLYGFTFCDERPRPNSTWGPHFHVS